MPQQPQAPFISSTEAAKRFNLTNDHIGLLCRRGKVQGTLLGRLWFVSEPSLAAYIQKNAEAQATRRTQLSKQWSAAWTAALFAFAVLTFSGGHIDAAVPVGAQLSVETVTVPLPEPSPLEKGTAFIKHSFENIPQVKPIAAVALAPATARPHAPTLRIVYAKRVVNGVLESPGIAAVASADSSTNLAALIAANETLGAINDTMFGIYTYAVLSIWKIAAFEANAAAYVADKTFGEFGRRFVYDVYALGDAQAHFYMQSAAALSSSYNKMADTVETAPMPESSISIANAWDGWVAFFSKISAPAKVPGKSSSPARTEVRSGGDLLSAAKPAAGQTFVQGSSPSLAVAQPRGQEKILAVSSPRSEEFLQGLGAKQINYVTQSSLNAQFDAWMQTMLALTKQNSVQSQATLYPLGLGNFGGGGSVVNNYITQRIDKLDGVTITHSSINGVSDFSNLGAADGIGSWFTPTLYGNATSTTIGFLGGLLAVGSTTLNGNLTVAGGATTTSFAILNLTDGSCDVKATSGGVIYCGTDSTSAGAANPFAWPTNFGVTVAATSSPLWAQSGLFASSTSHFANADFISATTTTFAITGTANTLLKTTAAGSVVAAIAGTDYVTPLSDIQFSTTSAAYFASLGLAFSTTSSDYWVSLKGYSTAQYPFAGAGNSTSSLVQFNGGLTAANLLTTGSSTLQNFTANNATTSQATTTNLAITSVSSALLKTLSSGAVVAAIAGTDYLTSGTIFAYPFPNNATTTSIAFNGGLTATNITTSGSTTIAGQLNAVGGATFGNVTIGSLGGVLYGTNGVVGTIATNTLGLLSSSSISASAPLQYAVSTGVFSITQSSGSTNGYLSSADYTTFNNKISSSSLSGGQGISYNSSTGVITNTIGYAFPSNATSTSIAFNGGLTAANILTTGSSTLANFTANNATTSNATTTSFAITNISGALLKTLSNGAVVAAIAGTDYLASGALYAFPYTATSNYGVAANATSTPIWFQSGLFASSTSRIASTTFDINGNVGIGSTTPGSLFAINGIANFTTGTSTIYNNVNVQGQLKVGTGSIFFNGVSTSTFSHGISTAALTVSGFASTTDLIISSAGGVAGCATFSTNGMISNTGTACGSGGGGTFPYTPTQNFGALANSTSTAIWFQQGIQASSTSRIASTTFDINGNVGIGTTSPISPFTLGLNQNAVTRMLISNTTSGTAAQSELKITNGINSATFGFINTGFSTSSILVPNLGYAYSDGVAGFAVIANNALGAIKFATGGINERMRIDQNGNVGIGTTTPDSKLQVYGFNRLATFISNGISGNDRHAGIELRSELAGTNQYLDFASNSTSTSSPDFDWRMINNGSLGRFDILSSTTVNAFSINAAGNVGIGSTTPWGQLSVNPNGILGPAFVVGSTTGTSFLVDNAGNVVIGSTSPMTVVNPTKLTITGNGINSGTIGLLNTNLAGYSGFNIHDYAGTLEASFQYGGYTAGAFTNQMALAARGSTTTLGFYTSPSGVLTQQMAITSAGNVGIGTSTPYSTLEILPAAVSWGEGIVLDPSATGFSGIFFRKTGTSGGNPTGTWALAKGADGNLSFTNQAVGSLMTFASTTANVGIGTTSPWAKFSIFNSTSNPAGQSLFAIGSTTGSVNTTLFEVSNSGLTTIGDPYATGDANMQFAADANAWSMGYYSSDKSFRIASSTNLASGVALTIAKGASTNNVGVGSGQSGGISYPLDVAGDIRTSSCLRYNNSTLGSCSSDAALKRDVTDFQSGLDIVKGLRPVNFYYNGLGGNPDDNIQQIGFVAQDIEKVAPELVGNQPVRLNSTSTMMTMIKTVNYSALPYLTLNAVKELNANFEAIFLSNSTDIHTILLDTATSTIASTSLKARTFSAHFWNMVKTSVFAWLADAANGLTKVFAKEVQTDKLCVGNTCVTEEQFLAMVAASSNNRPPAPAPTPTPAPEPEPEPQASSTPPVPEEETPEEVDEPEEDPVVIEEVAPPASDDAGTTTPQE